MKSLKYLLFSLALNLAFTSLTCVNSLAAKELSNKSEDTWAGEWKRIKGDVKKKWGKLTDDQMTESEGNRDKLVGYIQQKYGETKEAINDQIDSWLVKK